MRGRWLLGIALVLQGSPIAPQRPQEPKRPRMDIGRDTNSGPAYYYYGITQLRNNPRRAADAFYWAMRLEPGMAEPYYGTWAALLLQQPTRMLGDFFSGEAYLARSTEFQHIDSLRYQALIREPLLYWKLDQVLIEDWLDRVTHGQVTLLSLSSEFGPEMAAWWSYGQGRFEEALRQYAIAVARHPKWYDLRLARARAFIPLLQYDSAAALYGEVLTLQRSVEQDHLVHSYDSKELANFTIGRLREVQGRLPAAREAYELALLENLAFYPAHAALARIALLAGDTTNAVREYDQALELHADDPVLRCDYGALLFALKRYTEAADQFQHAVDEEPYYARPYLPLAYLRESEGKDSIAIAYYRRFIQIAPADYAVQVQKARQLLGELSLGHH